MSIGNWMVAAQNISNKVFVCLGGAGTRRIIEKYSRHVIVVVVCHRQSCVTGSSRFSEADGINLGKAGAGIIGMRDSQYFIGLYPAFTNYPILPDKWQVVE